ncbi:MAG: hypothetical protein A2Z14_08600 [Chloroflexi bacterium RBG_16_48_8]|nr:MAG: hypothetical protein A2Z14_08600 [Chloroflexi bacterium RBG_16_48_8]
MNEELLREIEVNYAMFHEKLPDLIPDRRGKFALIRHGEIIEFYDTARDAFLTGQKLFDDDLFSVQEVIEFPIDLGFFSHAVPDR